MRPLTIYHLVLLAISLLYLASRSGGSAIPWIVLAAFNAIIAMLSHHFYRNDA